MTEVTKRDRLFLKLAMIFSLAAFLAVIFFLLTEYSRSTYQLRQLRQLNEQHWQVYSKVLDKALLTNKYADRSIEQMSAIAYKIEQVSLSTKENQDHVIEAGLLNAWDLLTNGKGGDFGKSNAIKYVAKHGEQLSGLDLSCPELEADKCLNPVRLVLGDIEDFSVHGLTLDHAKIDTTFFLDGRLTEISAKHATFHGVEFRGTSLSEVQFQNTFWRYFRNNEASFQRANFNGAVFRGGLFESVAFYNTSFDGALLEHVNFSDSLLTNVSFVGAGISGADFSKVKFKGDIDFQGAWAWQDLPPSGLDSEDILFCPWTETEQSSTDFRGLQKPADCN